MGDWHETLTPETANLREAIARIDASALQIALVVDANGRLLGTLTDGDVRRALLRGASLDAPVSDAMNTAPTVAHAGDNLRERLAVLRGKGIQRIPVVDADGRVIGLERIEQLAMQPPERDNWVVLMAGGLGSRLKPLTDDRPKPMLHVGDRPILETILASFVEQGFRRFFISVNYRGELVREHFGDGSRFGVEIRYLVEDRRLGTAGALSLLPERPSEPFFVMNGDILARVNFNAMLDFHAGSNAMASVGVRRITHSIPYGVVKLQGQRLVDIVEKPEEEVFVSAGIYVLSPAALDLVASGATLDMPSLLQGLMARGDAAVGFPIHEYWLDIGRMEDFARAHEDYGMVFK
ncbi:MAG TPA: nucleotidyltransferase family protein [Ramlibacter sp.]|uniref:nucleotidyltransferase family protein n=1 Tax=Ramlibacter sp. TaxID=1917967 RepID=UPI002B84A878|nr:nucleotidyltransferase family protein [Ramlibacter sp.]HVZ45355.1 nucleotidyltransferase family protein [Ramlibacter sp.]